MFSSSNSINPFLHLSPSNFLPCPLILPQNENNNTFIPQQNDEIFQNSKKKTKRKDRHSKIYTANGLRDRRVRLSIGISREFFKLQDILGFEKASQTISWLLKNSASSIKELEHKEFSNNEGLVNISPISKLCEEELGASVKDTNVKIKERKINKHNRASIYGPTRESRARARERTREKIMSTQKIDDANPLLSILSNNYLVSEIEACDEGMVPDVIYGSLANPKFEDSPITHKDWDKSLFTESEVLSKYFQTSLH